MSSISPALKTYNKMRKIFKLLTWGPLITSAVAAVLGAYMLYLATPPVNADYRAYDKWITDHQEQFLAEQSGRFYWTEMHSAALFGGIAIFAFAVAVFSIQIRIVSKVANVTARAVLDEAKEERLS